MAFAAYSNSSNAMMGGAGAPEVRQGPDLEMIQTEGLGFLSINQVNFRLTPRWAPPPAPTAQLLAIASRKGLVAAGAPDAVIIATTESSRAALSRSANDAPLTFAPQATIPMPMRISQLAFTADEQYLVISAEEGGGLAVYEVQALGQGNTQPAFQLSTNGESLRALIPNPMPESAAFCALVTNNGNLFMANFSQRSLVAGPNGPTLRTLVSCAAWSTKGKQLVAGMADGTIQQMTPDGTDKGQIPRPPGLGDYYMASLSWLENHVFLAIYNPTNSPGESVYQVINRQQTLGSPPSGFTFQKLRDPVEPFTFDKVPHHNVLRLKDFPPNLQDLLLVSSTSTESIGMISRSKVPLMSEKPAQAITNVFTTTELCDDSRRAQIPMDENFNTTYPVGVALDLSSKDQVYKPIPTDEMDMSPTPIPAIWVLNYDGMLSAWWIIYNDSVRTGAAYPGLAVMDGAVSTTALGSTAGPTSPFGGAASTTVSPFGGTANPTSAFGTASATTSAFGAPATAASAFGSPSPLGANQSPWGGGAPAFGQSSFGTTPSALTPTMGNATSGTGAFGSKATTPAFGESTLPGLANRPSPWSTGMASTQPTFGQSAFSSASPAAGKVFGMSAATPPTSGAGTPISGGFASFASQSVGFGSLRSGTDAPTSIFASKTSNAPEISMDTDTAFPAPSAKKEGSASAFGSSSSFVLGSTFKADPKTANDNENVDGKSGGSMFGNGFGLSLDAAAQQAPETRNADMDVATPTAVPAVPVNPFAAKSSETPRSVFGGPLTAANTSPLAFPSTTPTATPWATKIALGTTVGSPVKEEPKEEETNLADMPAAPLPPDPTSKPPFALSESSTESIFSRDTKLAELASSPEEDVKPEPEPAPLPPDFAPAKTKVPLDDAPLPPDPTAAKPSDAPPVPSSPDSPEQGELPESDEHESDEDDDDEEDDEGQEGFSEGSGVDVTKDLDAHTPGYDSHSSFGGMGASSFSAWGRPPAQQQAQRTLFGEASQVPALPKPVPQSPRSPSPVRGAFSRTTSLRNECQRSVSAPGMGPQVQVRHKPTKTIDPNVAERRKIAARKEAESQTVLEDPEDEGIQVILRSEVEPTLQMNEFIASETVAATKIGTGREEVADACEALWRDINRMIDRTGLNSRSLKSFILGHTVMAKAGGRHKEDVEQPDEWVLVEAEGLGSVVEQELGRELEGGRVKNVDQINALMQSLSRDLAKLRAKEDDLRKVIAPHVDPDQAAVSKSMPLSAEQAAQQNELRRSYATLAKQLMEAEEALSLLRVKLASVGGGMASANARSPTVDAVMRTINKMTSMAEKRSGDVDVLETQMRKLRLGTPTGDYRSGSPASSWGPRSREASPFVGTPLRQTGDRRSLLLMSSPERQSGGRLRDSFASSASASRTTPPRKKLSQYTDEEKTAVRARKARRGNMLGLLRASLQRNGPNVQRLSDDV